MNDKSQAKQPDQNKIMLINLVSTLAMSTMQQLGKMVNPATGKASVSMEGAQATIDMLDMISAKTNGNLDEEESKMLSDTLTMLKINYVETGKTAPAEKKDGAGDPGKEPETGKDAAAATAKTEDKQPESGDGTKPTESKEAKFHKSYG